MFKYAQVAESVSGDSLQSCIRWFKSIPALHNKNGCPHIKIEIKFCAPRKLSSPAARRHALQALAYSSGRLTGINQNYCAPLSSVLVTRRGRNYLMISIISQPAPSTLKSQWIWRSGRLTRVMSNCGGALIIYISLQQFL